MARLRFHFKFLHRLTSMRDNDPDIRSRRFADVTVIGHRDAP